MIFDYERREFPNEETAEQSRGFADECHYAVTSFSPDSPGWSGDILFVVWPAGAEYHEAFYIDEDGLNKIETMS